MRTRHITQTILVTGGVAAGFLAGIAFENTTTQTACTAAMDWADAAVRVAGQAWVDVTEPTAYDHHAAQQYAAAQECRDQL
ncbi:hypothetical protein ACT3UQ_05185 [Glutamicibacter sp. AOP12-B1-11]|uniref:hypothetical protein n=1 Tax=Glutamicibacter sp. AOP12-B1-11 TaxID=3457725 RepID=UPI0040334E6E